ncbi:hypothetical protein [Candidatus Formimonas warabiya]|uniref:Restriction endonuclease n=1 Tax=Formimonas warabiya TaxID=1761012 RepID=A0A3G1KSH4_FORW1|nr:hypothetical protein [Candidatus Formimonas warabiya]ATW25432.1 hypothetical protein DCMF_12185 [Candidatus Formimonas warabiya]
MFLFDNIERNLYGPAKRMEGYYTFLNRSANSESERQRDLLEQWFSGYPVEERLELSKRIKLNDLAAFFELFLHVLLIRLGCRVIVHPEVDNKKRPDFKVFPKTGQEFFLEAMVVSGTSHEEKQAQKRINQVLDLLDEMDFPGYMFHIEQTGKPKSQPSVTDIKYLIEEKLSKVDRKEIEKRYQDNDPRQFISWEYEHDGWHLIIIPIPAENGDRPIERSIAITSSKLVDFYNLKSRISEKALKYGTFEIPYIIAINAIGASQTDTFNALFGTLAYNKASHQSVRIPDGVWRDNKNTRVSAVLFANGLRTDNITRTDIKIIHNPWAKIRYDSILNTLPQVIGENGILKAIDGKSLREIFMLPLGWPEL